MPTPAEIILSRYPNNQITVDLAFGVSYDPDKLQTKADLDAIVRAAIRKSPLAILDANGLPTGLIEAACADEPILCDLASGSLDALDVSLRTDRDTDAMAQVEHLAGLGAQVSSLIRSIDTTPPEASTSWLRDHLQNRGVVFIPSATEPFLSPVRSDIAFLDAMSAGRNVHDGMTGPVFGYAGRSDTPEITLAFVSDALGDALLSDPTRLFAEKADAIDWDSAWAVYAEEHDGATFDATEMESLTDSLRSILSVIINRLHKETAQTRDADTLSQKMQSMLIQERPYIDAILAQWNTDQSSNYHPDMTRILTFSRNRPGSKTEPMDVRSLVGVLHDSASAGLSSIKRIATTRGDGGPIPWVQEMEAKLKDTYDRVIASFPEATPSAGVPSQTSNIVTLQSNVIPFPAGPRRNNTPSAP